jgi:hypothetical protein
MRYVIAGNPGLGVGPEWMDRCVLDVEHLDFTPYFQSDTGDLELEIKALFILGGKDGGGRESWLTDRKPDLFASAVSCREVSWLGGIEELRNRANRFIRKMRREAPYWHDFPLFEGPVLTPEPLKSSDVLLRIRALPLLSRIHLLSFAAVGGGSLLESTTYDMRSLGLNCVETAPLILNSGICEAYNDMELLARLLKKDEIIAALSEKGIDYKKSWNKTKLFERACSLTPEAIQNAAEKKKLARVKPEYLSDLRCLDSRASALVEGFRLLCFVSSQG